MEYSKVIRGSRPSSFIIFDTWYPDTDWYYICTTLPGFKTWKDAYKAEKGELPEERELVNILLDEYGEAQCFRPKHGLTFGLYKSFMLVTCGEKPWWGDFYAEDSIPDERQLG